MSQKKFTGRLGFSILALILVALGGASSVMGAERGHVFLGNLTTANVPGVAVGDPFVAVLTYDDDQVGTPAGATSQSFLDYTFSLHVAGVTYVEDPSSDLRVSNDAGFGDALFTNASGLGFAGFNLTDTTGTALSSLDLPAVLNIADYTSNFVAVGGGDLVGDITKILSFGEDELAHTFEGVATQASAPGVSVGDPVAAVLIYDTGQSGTPSGSGAAYTEYRLCLNAGGTLYSEDANSNLLVLDDTASGDAIFSNGTGSGFAGFNLSDSTGVAFDSTELPTDLTTGVYDGGFLAVGGGSVIASITPTLSVGPLAGPPPPQPGERGHVFLGNLTTANVPGVSVGDPFVAILTYDSSQMGTPLGSTTQSYPEYTFSLRIDGLTYVEDPTSDLRVNNDAGFGDALGTNGTGTGFAGFSLTDSNGSALSSLDLPGILDLSDFTSNFVAVGGGDLVGNITKILPFGGDEAAHAFEGVATQATAPGVSVGDPVAAALIYDTTQSGIPSGNGETYSEYRFCLNAGGTLYSEDPNSTLRVLNDTANGDVILSNGTGSGFGGFNLRDSTGVAFDSTELPTDLTTDVYDDGFLAVGGASVIASITPTLSVGPAVPDPQLIRGDCNADAIFDIADPVRTLGFLFPAGAPQPLLCSDACDANDDGSIDISDAVSMLSALFPSGVPTPLPAPHPACGVDPTADGLDCIDSSACP